jgi:hypothetical protein
MPRTYFDEIGIGLGWQAETVIAMLWLYLDESGEHNADGTLRRLTFGGGVAPFEAWAALALDWAAILESFNISMFHMTDFERWKPPFDFLLPNGERDHEKHNRLLSMLLDTMLKYVPAFWGVVDQPFNEDGGRRFQDHYQSNLAKATKDLWVTSSISGMPITVVFARHNQYSAQRIGRFFDLWKKQIGDSGHLEFGGIGNPETICPLQVADIVAYEFSRATRDKQPETMRYPLRRLKNEARVCSLVYARTLAQVF